MKNKTAMLGAMMILSGLFYNSECMASVNLNGGDSSQFECKTNSCHSILVYELWMQEGLQQMEKQNEEAALQSFNKCIVFAPNDTRAYLERGKLYASRYDYARALEDFTMCLQLDPLQTAVYLYIENCRINLHD